MSKRIPPKLYGALSNEINLWQAEGLIDRTLEEQLLSRYPSGSYQSNALTIVSIIGAVLVGLGTLLYIGANWQNIATIWKLLILIISVVKAHTAGWFLKFEPGNRPKLGSAFLLLGSLLFGAGIWLIAQMFNLGLDYQTGLLLWYVGTAFSALITRSTAVGVLSSVLLGSWALHIPDGEYIFGSLTNARQADWQIVAGTVAGLALACTMRSAAMAWVTLIFCDLWILMISGTYAPGLLMWGFTLFAGWLWLRDKLPALEQPFKYVGAGTILASMIFLTLQHSDWLNNHNNINYNGLIAGALAANAGLYFTIKARRNEALAGVLLISYFILFTTGARDSDFGRVVASNILALITISGMAWSGMKQLQSPGLLNCSVVFAVIYIICRYFDFFLSMMDRSLFFIVGGTVLMTIGAFAERGRRQLLGSIA